MKELKIRSQSESTKLVMRKRRFMVKCFHSIGVLSLVFLVWNFTVISNRKTEMTKFTKDEILQYKNGWTDDENERFLKYIRLSWLVAPSHGVLNGESLESVDYSQYGQSTLVDEVRIPL